jgi:hypothetical protein
MAIPGTQTVAAAIAPSSTGDLYPTHVDTYGLGGFRSITTAGSDNPATAAQLNAQVAEERRKAGMLVFDTRTVKYYRCTSASGSWVQEEFGAGGGTISEIGLDMPAGFTVTGSPLTSNGTLQVSTSLSGLIKGTGSGFEQATAGMDYSAPGHTHAVADVGGLSSNRLLGRHASGTGAAQQITVGTGLSLDQATGVLTAQGTGGVVQSISAAAPIVAATMDAGQTYSLSHTRYLSTWFETAASTSVGASNKIPRLTLNDSGHIVNAEELTVTGFLPSTGGTVTGNVAITGTGAGNLSVDGDLVVAGDLTVTGTQTILNTTTLAVEDRNIELGTVESPTDATANGGGITLRGATDKTFEWLSTSSAWTSSEHLELAAARAFRIDGTEVLSKTSLGAGVLSSSLTSVGTITSGAWQGSAIGLAHGGTGADLSASSEGTIFKRGSGTALVAAVAGTDYLDHDSTIDGGGY